MKNINRLIKVTLITLLTLTSCKNEKKIIIKEFQSSQKLKGTPLTSVKPYYPQQIIVQDSLMIVLNRKGDYFFQVYDTKSMDLLVEFGSNGRGPGEFNEPAFTNQKNKIDGEIYHLVYDTGSKKISYINFNDFIKDKATVIKQENLSKKLGNPDRLIYYSDTLTITAPGDEVIGRFQILKGDTIKTIDYQPKLPFKIHKDNLYYTYANLNSLIDDETQKIVATTSMLGQYDFFDFKGNLLNSSIIDRDKKLKKNVSTPINFKKPVMFYQTELKNVGNLIYSIYYKYKSSEGSSSTKSRIHVFDWDGNLIKEYLLDKLILSFAYDDSNNCFYGIAPYEEEYQIIKYDLDNIER